MGGWLRPGAFAAVVTVLLAGCFPFPPFFGDPFGGPIPTFCEDSGPSGSPTEFTHLSATVVLSGGETGRTELGDIPGGSGSMAITDACGTYVHGGWSDPKGNLVLTVDYPALEDIGMPGPSHDPGLDVAISLQQPNRHPPVVFFSSPDASDGVCTVTLTEHDSAGLVGHADCPGSWWHSGDETDPFAPPPSGTPMFDLSIDFSALP